VRVDLWSGVSRPTSVTIKVGGALVLSLGLLTACTGSGDHSATPATGVLHGQVAAYGGPVGARNDPVTHQFVALLDGVGHVVASTRTDTGGTYSLRVKPGPYRVVGDVCTQAMHHVTVVAGQTQRLDLICQMR
jgi:hypothetical protein